MVVALPWSTLRWRMDSIMINIKRTLNVVRSTLYLVTRRTKETSEDVVFSGDTHTAEKHGF